MNRSISPDAVRTLGQLLQAQAAARPDAVLFTFLADGEATTAELTLGELWRAARAVAVELARRGLAGERAVLVYASGLDFMPALFGCFLAGVVAVPAPPPGLGQTERAMQRLRGITRDCGAAAVLTTADLVALQQRAWPDASVGPGVWLATDAVDRGLADEWTAQSSNDPDALAYLQYTSGSTADAKGVMLSHRNILQNCREITDAYDMRPDSVMVCWAPTFHDLGLVFGVIVPVFIGHRSVLMPAERFAERPIRWLRAISRHRATHTVAPNTAYDLVVLRTRPDERVGLDLSSLRMLLNGAEPIRAATGAQFLAAYAPFGLTPDMLSHSYGLAESTATVTADRPGARGRFLRLDPDALTRHRVVVVGPDRVGREYADCGICARGTVVAVDPDSERRVADDRVGELWIRGQSVGLGYWGRADETRERFAAHLADTGEGPFYRTGDLGFVRDGHVYVTGRLKDMIIVRGENHYPQDIEDALLGAHAALRANCAVAFGVDDGAREQLVIVAEAYPERLTDAEAVFAAIRGRTADLGLKPATIVLVAPGTVPKTTSGKLQRRKTRAMHLEGAWTELTRWTDAGDARRCEPETGLRAATGDEQELLAIVLAAAAAALGVRAAAIDPARPLQDHGLDSLMAIDLRNRLATATGVRLDTSAVLQLRTPGRLVAALRERFVGPAVPSPGGDTTDLREPPPARVPAAAGQARLYFLDRALRRREAYNIHLPARLSVDLDGAALRQALAALVARHEQLRVRFVELDGALWQELLPELTIPVEAVDLTHLDAAARAADIERRTRAHALAPFDLSAPPLLRVLLLRTGADESLLVLTCHHIIIDGTSLGVLLRELSAAYLAARAAVPCDLPPAPSYRAHSERVRTWLAGAEAAAHREFWRTQLAALPPLDLPTDHPAPLSRGGIGGVVDFRCDAALAAAIDALARRTAVTPSAVLLAAWALLLRRYSRQDDFAVGVVTSGRDDADLAEVVGFFVNTVPLRAAWADDATVEDLLRLLGARVWSALDHQALPFDEIVQLMPPTRRSLGATPLLRVCFVFEEHTWIPRRFAEARYEPLWRSVSGDVEGTAKFDLTLVIVRDEAGYRASIEYDAELFAETTAWRMAGHLRTLLAGMITAPQARASTLELSTPAERARLAACNDTASPVPDACIHHLFAAQARRTPDATAVTFERSSLSYAELDARADRLAHHLIARGVRLESRVGLYLERSLDLVVAILAILKSGAAYVPLDPAYPRDRLVFMARDAGLALLLSHAHLAFAAAVPRLDLDTLDLSHLPATAPSAAVSPDNLAYTLYTSGSTGTPKGVAVTHRGLPNLVAARAAWQPLGPGRHILLFASFGFDAAVFDLFAALATGTRVVVASDDERRDPIALTRLLAEVSAVVLPPATLTLLDPDDLPDLSLAVAGEQCPPLAALRWSRGRVLLNLYGPTEMTVWSTAWRTTAVTDRLPIGRPIANTRAHLLDRHLQPVPIAVPGELYLAGVGLARGYLNRPALTAERFLPDPFGPPGSRMYRTGDLARWNDDGDLEFLGRIDQQVKIRGFRVELGEIEACLATHAGVARCVVVAREDAPGDRHLVAYVVPDAEGCSPAALREHLARTLPDHMLPAAFVLLDALPLTPSGKLDRNALPVPDARRLPDDAHVAPRSPAEHVLVDLWQDLLGLRGVGVHDDFFALGGHSLLAIRLLSAVRAAFGRAPGVSTLFQHPTVAALAAALDEATVDPIALVPRDSAEPPFAGLSSTERRLWFLAHLYRDARAYQAPHVRVFHGPLSVPALRRSLDDLVARHDILRTVYRDVAGAPVRVVTADPVPLRLVDVAETPDPVAATRDLIVAAIEAPFDLAGGPLTRALLVRRGEHDHVLLLLQHHIIADEWSQGLLLREWSALYAGQPPAPPPALQYADFARAEDLAVREDRLSAARAYWRHQLAAVPRLGLPIVRPAEVPGPEAFVARAVPVAAAAALRALALTAGCTPFIAWYAVFIAVLARYSGQTDFALGSVVANRETPGTDAMLGFFTNTVVLRTSLAGDPSLRELLARARTTALAAYRHQAVPFDLVVDDQHAARHLGDTPFYDVAIAEVTDPTADDSTFRPPGDAEVAASTRVDSVLHPLRDVLHAASITAKDPLAISVAHGTDDRAVLHLSHDTTRVAPRAAARLLEHVHTLLLAALADPDRPLSSLPLLTPAETADLARWNTTATPYPADHTVASWFAEQARRTPDATAVTFDDAALTYAALDAAANRLAHHLVALGVRPEARVALCLERSLELVVGLLATVKAGGVYVPLDPGHPPRRLAHIVDDARATLVLTQAHLAARLSTAAPILRLDADAARWAALPATPPPANQHPDNILHILYTSGSTGQPKGVLVPHRGVVALLSTAYAARRYAGPARVLHRTLAFDTLVLELLGPLMHGACVVVLPPGAEADSRAIARTVRERGVTYVDVPPTLLGHLVHEPDFCHAPALRLVNVGGEALPPALAAEFARRCPGVALWNAYGPTEATVEVALWPVPSTYEPPAIRIGRPLPNTRLYVLDAGGEPVPPGLPGELFIAGVGLARGYLDRPGATAAAFLPDPFSPEPGARMYGTGDRVRLADDGDLEFLGRVDEQVKIRGFRVEPGEIEAALATHPAVAACVVRTQSATSGATSLVALVVAGAPGCTPTALREHLRSRLPDPMIPGQFVLVDELPRTPAGKLDRRPLPPAVAGPVREAPRTEVELALAAIWQQVLGVEQVGAHDDFFALGGNSILGLRVVHLAARVGLLLRPQDLYSRPTIALLSAGDAAHAGGELDLRREATLPRDLRFIKAPRPDDRGVFLTGATGFVGVHLLHQLQARSQRPIFCLVHGADETEARVRLRVALHTYGLTDVDLDRVHVVLGDLTRPRFGLTPGPFAELAAAIGTVIHSGARVHHFAPYASLRAANVDGTTAVLELCARARASLHHLSTADVPADGPPPPHAGYKASKWVAERLVLQAREAGLACTIHRLGLIGGDTRTGALPRRDYWLTYALRLRLGMAAVPDQPLQFLPVDFVAGFIAADALRGCDDATFDLDADPLAPADAAACVRSVVGQCRVVPLDQWRTDAPAWIRVAHPDDDGFLHILTVLAAAGAARPAAGDTTAVGRARQRASAMGLAWPASGPTLAATLRYVHGLAAPPAGTSKRRATSVEELRALLTVNAEAHHPPDLAVRATDVFIATYPKCGTTWTQQIVHGLRTRGAMDFPEISYAIPYIDIAHRTGVDLHAPQSAEPRAFKTHHPWSLTPKGGRYIYVVRDPRDALLSAYHFYNGWYFERDTIDIRVFSEELFFQDVRDPSAYWPHVRSWWDQRANPDVLFLCYEDMQADCERAVRRIAAFMGLDADPGLIDVATRQASFEFMRAHADQFDERQSVAAMSRLLGLPADSKITKVRTGRVGEGARLPPDVLARLDAVWRAEIAEPLGIASYAELRTRARESAP